MNQIPTNFAGIGISKAIGYIYRESELRAMTTLRYKILLRKEDGTYTVIVPSLPGCLTFGHTVEEILARAKEAIEGFIACMIERGEEVPIETDDEILEGLMEITFLSRSNLPADE